MENFNNKMKKIIAFFVTIFVISLIVIIVCLLMLKYEVEGEGNMPFELSQMVIVSTAEGIDIDGDATWNFDIVQNNDIYLYISKNKNYKEREIIKSITIDNFKIEEKPEKGNIKLYRPSKDESTVYEYSSDYVIEESLTYEGNENTNLKNLEIANQGGIIILRCTNDGLRNIYIRRRNYNA